MEPTSEIRSRFRLFFLYLSHFAFSRIKFVFFFSFKNDFYTVVFGVKSQYKKKKSEGCGWVIAEATERERERECVSRKSPLTHLSFSRTSYMKDGGGIFGLTTLLSLQGTSSVLLSLPHHSLVSVWSSFDKACIFSSSSLRKATSLFSLLWRWVCVKMETLLSGSFPFWFPG